MKVVRPLSDNFGRVRSEFETLKRVHSDLLVQTVGDLVHNNKGCGYAMQPVGRSVVFPTDSMRDVLMSLVQLHRQNIVHGDPRIANLICDAESEQQLIWLDPFAVDSSTSTSLYETDMVILVRSLMRVDVLPRTIFQNIINYSVSPADSDKVETLISSVLLSCSGTYP